MKRIWSAIVIILIVSNSYAQGKRGDLFATWREVSLGYSFIDLDGGPAGVIAIARRGKLFFLLKWNTDAYKWDPIVTFPAQSFGKPFRVSQASTSRGIEIWMIADDGRIERTSISASENGPHPTPIWKHVPRTQSQPLDISTDGSGATFVALNDHLIGHWQPQRDRWEYFVIREQTVNLDAQYRTDVQVSEVILALKNGRTAVFQPEKKNDGYRWIDLRGEVYDVAVPSATSRSRVVWSTGFQQTKTIWGAFLFLYQPQSVPPWKWVYPGAAVRITMDDDGNPWVINKEMKIFSGHLQS